MKKVFITIIISFLLVIGVFILTKGFMYRNVTYFIESTIPKSADIIECTYTEGSVFSFSIAYPNYSNESTTNKVIMDWFIPFNVNHHYPKSEIFKCQPDEVGCHITLSKLNTNTPILSSNRGLTELKIAENHDSEILLLEYQSSEHLNVIRIDRDKGIIITTKNALGVGYPYAAMYLGQCKAKEYE